MLLCLQTTKVPKAPAPPASTDLLPQNTRERESLIKYEVNTLRVLQLARAQTCKIHDSDHRHVSRTRTYPVLAWHASMEKAHCQRQMALGTTCICIKHPRFFLCVGKIPSLVGKKGSCEGQIQKRGGGSNSLAQVGTRRIRPLQEEHLRI